jgi:hypothetical protein
VHYEVVDLELAKGRAKAARARVRAAKQRRLREEEIARKKRYEMKAPTVN